MSCRVPCGILALVLALALALASTTSWAAPIAPLNFRVENAFTGVTFTQPVDLAWLPDGRALVAEKRGMVWVVTNGVKSSQPLLDLRAQVLDADDRGLLAVAVHPNYFVNHYLYVMYTVDPDSNGIETNSDAYGRLVRYTMNFTDSSTVVPTSRAILFGRTWSEGAISCSPSHTIGDLVWGADGSLLVSAGEGASFSETDGGGLHPGSFGPGKFGSYDDIGAFRAQSLSSIAGKVLRINPITGSGYASNPFADSNLFSARSRVWAYGLRNPFRFTVRPGTGVADTSAGNPGVLFIGDVGWNTWEEENVAPVKGRNFGWPCYEGPNVQSWYQSANPPHNGCGSFGTADNPSSATPPACWYNHSSGGGSFPSGMVGNAATCGVFYTGTSYPVQYRNQFVFGDYGQDWIRLGTIDANHAFTATTSFITAADAPVCMSVDPVSKDLLYVSISAGEVRRIRYEGSTGNGAPVANATATPGFGPAPLAVAFSSAGTADPNNDPFTISWSFGDGTGSTAANPSHTYGAAGVYAAILTATDIQGAVGRDTVTITATASSGFPSAAVLDAFDRPDGAIGGAWVDETSGLVINANALAQNAADNTTVWNGASFGANQEAYFRFNAINVNAPEHDLMLKVQGTSWSAGHIEVKYDGGLRAVKVSTYAPTQSWIGRGGPWPVSFVSGDVFGARALADGTVEVYRNGGRIGTASVGSWPFAAQGGRVGLTLVGTTGSLLDDFGGGDVRFGNNTPPTATITSPLNGAFYIAGQTISLTGTASDSQDPSSALAYHWDVEVHHNNHIHYAYTFDTPSASFPAENHDDGTGVFYRIALRVRDTGGLETSSSVDIFPEIDLTPTAITVTPAAPTSSDPLTINFQVRNLGRLPAPYSRWRLVRGTTLVGEGDIIVPANGTVSLSVPAGPLAAGNYTLRVKADSLDAVREINESNNASVLALTVTSPSTPNRPPVASASGSPSSGAAPLAVSFSSAGSSDPDGDPLTYSWAFGDGQTSTAANPANTYANAGSYSAVLTVSDGRGGSATATVPISVSPPPPPPAGFPATAVRDDFNRPDGPLTGSWSSAGGVNILANRLAPTTAAASPVWNGAVFAASQEAYVTLSTIPSSVPEIDLMLKVQGSSWDTGHIQVRYDALRSRIRVSTYAPAGGWVTRGGVVQVTFAAGDRLGARAFSNGTVEVYRNTTPIAARSISGWPFTSLGGRIGLGFAGANGARLDDFGGGDVTGAPVPLAVTPSEDATGSVPGVLALSNPYPNPTTGGVSFELELPRPSDVDVTIFDLQGRVLWSDPARALGPGRWVLGWNGRLASGADAGVGLYLARVRVEGAVFTRRFVRAR